MGSSIRRSSTAAFILGTEYSVLGTVHEIEAAMQVRFDRLSLTAFLFAALASVSAAQEAKPAGPAAPKITYDEHVRPILREHCFSCHSADKQESG